MKNVLPIASDAAYSPIPQTSQTPKIPSVTKQETKVVEDIVDLNSSTNTPKPVTYEPPAQPLLIKKPAIITFPEDVEILNETILLDFKACQGQLNIDDILYSIENVRDLDSAVELVIYSLKEFKRDKSFLKDVMAKLFQSYDSSAIINHKSLSKLNIKKVAHNQMIYKLSPGINCHCKYNNLPAKVNEKELPFVSTLKSKHIVIMASIKNGNKHHVEKDLREIFKTADIVLNCLKRSALYEEVLTELYCISSLVELEFQYEVFDKLKHHFTTYKSLLSSISKLFLENGEYMKTIELLEPLILNVEIDSNDIDLAFCNYNLAVAYFNNCSDTNALKCFQAAYEALPGDVDVIKHMLQAYVSMGKIDEAIQFVKTLPESDIKNFFQYSLDLNGVTMAKLKKINEQKLPDSLRGELPLLKIMVMFGEQNAKGAKIDSKFFTERIQKLEKQGGLLPEGLIFVALRVGLIKLAGQIFQKLPESKIAKSPLLQKIQTLVDNSNATLPSLINSYKIEDSKKTELFVQAGSACLSENSNENAMKHALEGLKLEPENEELAEIGLSAALVLKNQQKAQEFMDLLSPEKKEEVIQSYNSDSSNTSESIETQEQDLIKNYDPKKIHQYHTIKKQQELAKIQASSSIMQTRSVWKIGNQEIKILETVNIGKYRSLDCWAIIGDKIKRKVSESMPAFTAALEKGIITEKIGQNGIKFLNNKAVELKIDGDKRLFTNNIYVNDEGKLLIIFDHEGNHEAVDNFVHRSKLTYLAS